MAQLSAKWILKDSTTLVADGSNLKVKLNATNAIEATADGLQVKADGITNSMLAGSIVEGKLANTFVRADGANAFAADQSMGGYKLTNLATPVADTDAATKIYVDNVAQGLDPKASCRVATTASITLSGTQTIDGIALSADDRVLVKSQGGGVAEVSTISSVGGTPAGLGGKYVTLNSASVAYYVWFNTDSGSTDPAVADKTGIEVAIATGDTESDIAGKIQVVLDAHANFLATVDGTTVTVTNADEGAAADITAGDSGLTVGTTTQGIETGADNGIYLVKAGAWVRSNDFDGTPSNEVTAGAFTFVEEGTDNHDTGWVLSTNNPVIVGETGLTWVQFSAAGQYDAGSGLSLTGLTFAVNVDDTGIEINADTLRLKDAGVTTAKIADDAVDKAKIAADVAGLGLGQNIDGSLEVNVDGSTIEVSVDTLQVKDAGIVEAKIADDAVTRDKIAANVAGDGLDQDVDGSLKVNVDGTTLELATDAIQIKAGGVGATQLAADAVTAEKLNADTAGAGLVQNATTGALDVNPDDATLEVASDIVRIKDLGVTTGKLNDGAVTTIKIADANVTTDKIADANVTTGKIADDAVDKAKIAADVAGVGLVQDADGSLKISTDDSTLEVSVDTLQVKDAGITTAKLADDAVDKAKVAADVAGDGLAQDLDGSLKVNADGSTLEIATDVLQVKNAGIGTAQLADDAVDKAKIAADVAGLGLGQNVDGSLEVTVDDVTLEISTDTVRIKDSGVDENKIASDSFGSGIAGGGGSVIALSSLTADWNLGGTNKITGAPTPTADSDVATKAYVDTELAGAEEYRVDTYTLDATDITNKYVALSSAPSIPSDVVLQIKNAPAQFYGDDYQMDGINPDRVSWDGLGLDTVLEAGDKLTVVYSI